MEKMRLDRCLAGAGIGTRSEVKVMIKKGLIQVNEEYARKPEMKVDIQNDRILVSGKPVVYHKYSYYMFHKPAGCVTATEDARFETVMDYLDVPGKKKLFPVGRLDRDCEGLLLITNDGTLAHELLSPKKHVTKVYYVKVDGCVSAEDVTKFETGLDIGDEQITLPAKLEIVKADPCSECLVTITEGRFHQVKRMFEKIGKTVIYLKRLSMGALTLDDTLEKGAYRPLTDEEAASLRG